MSAESIRDRGRKSEAYETIAERAAYIYEKWQIRRTRSRSVVGELARAVTVMAKEKTRSAAMEAFSLLLALEMRIETRYRTIIGTILHYFAYKRETAALERFRFNLGIKSHSVRAALEAQPPEELEKLLSAEEDDGDKTGGGKSRGKSEQEPEQSASETEAAEEQKDRSEPGKGAEKDSPEKDEKVGEAEEAEKTEGPSEKQDEKAESSPEADISKEADTPKEESAPEAGEAEKSEKPSSTEPTEAVEEQKKDAIDLDYLIPPPVIEEYEDAPTKTEVPYFPKYSEALGTDLDVITTEAALLKQKTSENVNNDLQIGYKDVERAMESRPEDLNGAYIPTERGADGVRTELAAAPSAEAATTEAQAPTETAAQNAEPQQTQISNDQENLMRQQITANMTEEQLIVFRDAMQLEVNAEMERQTTAFIQAQMASTEEKVQISVPEASEDLLSHASQQSHDHTDHAIQQEYRR